MSNSDSSCNVRNFKDLIDLSKWHRMLFIVPMSQEEIESARKSALREFDDITQEYKDYDLKISYASMINERDKFIESLNTDAGYYVEGADVEKDHKIYWWSYGYGFQNPVVLSVSKRAMASNEGVILVKDAPHCNCELAPYEAVGCEDIFKFYESDVAAIKSLEAFNKVFEDETSKSYEDIASKTVYPGMSMTNEVKVIEVIDRVRRFFDENPDGMITFRGISDPAECVC